MASRKEQKEQARAARLAQEQQAASKAQRTRRMQILGGIVAIAVIVIAVVVVISTSGGSKSPTASTNVSTKQNVATVKKLLNGIPQTGQTLGDPKAKVTMTYFGDLECSICDAFTLNELPTFISTDVRTHKVKITYRSFCTATCNNTSEGNAQDLFNTQQVAAYAAGLQNKFWDFAELFYHEQGTEDTDYVTNKYLTGLATQAGLNLSKWTTDRKDPSLLDQVTADENLASSDGAQGTPTFVLKGPKGSLLVPETQTCSIDGESFGFPCAAQLSSDVSQVS